METLPAVFAQQARAYGPRTLFLRKIGGTYQPITWAEAAADVARLASFFVHAGVRRGDRILLLCENRPEWGIADLAIQTAGAWTVPVYPTLAAADVTAIASDCQPVIAIASTLEQWQKLKAVAEQIGSIERVLLIEGSAGERPRFLTWSQALAEGEAAQPKQAPELQARLAAVRPEDTATLIYTSGTTGEPKGVMLSHRNFLSNVRASLSVFDIGAEDVHLSFLPLCHVFERMAGWYLILAAGGTVAYAENMDTIPENMREVRPTMMLGVPRFFEKLYARVQEGIRQSPPLRRRITLWAIGVGRAHAAAALQGARPSPWLAWQHRLADRLVYHKVRERLGGRLKFFISGSAPLPKHIGEFFYCVGVAILEGYGLTETSPVITVNLLSRPKFGTVGPVLPGVEVRIADDGEILSRGPHIMQGYYKKPDATAAVIRDGWFATGDIGYLDPDGYLVITDRKKDLIKTAGGKFVAPQKLENLFLSDPAIAQVFVFGDRRPYCVALVVPSAAFAQRQAAAEGWHGATMEELAQDPRVLAWYWARIQEKQRDLPSFEQVKRIALLGQEFTQASGELTPTLKAKRATIASRYEAALQRLYDAPAFP